MNIEAYAIVVELLAQAHAHGEAIAAKLELWIGVSSGLIVMAYFAPDRMRISITTLVLGLYIGFTVFIFTNVAEDRAMTRLAVADAMVLAQANDIEASLLEYRAREGHGSGETRAFIVVALGLFFGTIGYLGMTAYDTWRKGSASGNGES